MCHIIFYDLNSYLSQILQHLNGQRQALGLESLDTVDRVTIELLKGALSGKVRTLYVTFAFKLFDYP